jgi:hypothetical protein
MSALLPLRRAPQSALSPAFAGMLGALLLIAVADTASTLAILQRGGIELSQQTAQMQRLLGLPLWSIVWILLHCGVVAICAALWWGSLWFEPFSPWLTWPLRTARTLFLCLTLVWNVWHLPIVIGNLNVLAHWRA